ncbi:MAG TPA: hypothetical protein VF771_01695 [Longimicrobiaceae bacterium]
MRSRINLLAFLLTLGAAGTVQLGDPLQAHATMSPSPFEFQYCCFSARTKCCGNNYCAITPDGCTKG